MEEMQLSSLEKYSDTAVELIMTYGPKVILAIIVLLVGLRVIKSITNLVSKGFEKRNVDPTLRPFILNLTNVLLKVMLFVSVASMIGIETTSFVAILGAAGLAVGLALQGTLANFAGGVLILLFKPYKVGDLIDAQGHFGHVSEIQIFITKINTPDGKVAIVPNGSISNGSLTNLSTQNQLRVDLVIGISYDSNIKHAKELLLDVMSKNSKVLNDPAPIVAVSELADSSVNLAVRPWATPENYWDVYFETLEAGKLALDEANIVIPFPQRDVHMIKD